MTLRLDDIALREIRSSEHKSHSRIAAEDAAWTLFVHAMWTKPIVTRDDRAVCVARVA